MSRLRHIEVSVPTHLDVHLICDNRGTPKYAKVRTWLAKRRAIIRPGTITLFAALDTANIGPAQICARCDSEAREPCERAIDCNCSRLESSIHVRLTRSKARTRN